VIGTIWFAEAVGGNHRSSLAAMCLNLIPVKSFQSPIDGELSNTVLATTTSDPIGKFTLLRTESTAVVPPYE